MSRWKCRSEVKKQVLRGKNGRKPTLFRRGKQNADYADQTD